MLKRGTQYRTKREEQLVMLHTHGKALVKRQDVPRYNVGQLFCRCALLGTGTFDMRIRWAISYCKPPSAPTATCTLVIISPAAMWVSNSREIAGKSVRIKMWSTMRAPLSTSVQRLAMLVMSAWS